jgi:hypothetical protein
MNAANSYMNIDLLGNIFMVDEIIYYDKPLTFTCKNDIGNMFIASCTELDYIEKWLFLPVSNARLIQILRGSITAYDAFKNPELDFLWEVSLKANDYTMGEAKKTYPNMLLDEDLPDKEIVFDILGEETFTIKNEDRIGIVEDSVKERREIFDLSIESNGSHIHEIEASFLGKVLEGTQNIVNSIAHKKGFNGKVPKYIKEQNKLIYTGEYAASFGFRLKSHSLSNILNESELQENLETFMNLLQAKADTEKITEILKELNPSVVVHYRNFLSILKKENVAIKTYCAFPNQHYRSLETSLKDITESLNALESNIKEVSKEDTLFGEIVAIDTTARSFKFISDDDEIINGTINDGVNPEEYRLPKNAEVKLKITIKLNGFTGREKIEYELLELVYE